MPNCFSLLYCFLFCLVISKGIAFLCCTCQGCLSCVLFTQQLPKAAKNKRIMGREMVLFDFKNSLCLLFCFLFPNMSMFHSWKCFFSRMNMLPPPSHGSCHLNYTTVTRATMCTCLFIFSQWKFRYSLLVSFGILVTSA